MPNLVDGWFCDRAPGQGKIVYATPGQPSTAAPVGGVVGVGHTGSLPASYAPLMPAGSVLPPPGPANAAARAQFLAVLAAASGLDSNTSIGPFPTHADSTEWSLSCWLNFGVKGVVGFNPTPQDGTIFCLQNANGYMVSSRAEVDPAVGALTYVDGNGGGATANINWPVDVGTGVAQKGWVHLMVALRFTGNPDISASCRMIAYANDTPLFNGYVPGEAGSGGIAAFGFSTNTSVLGYTSATTPGLGSGLYAGIAEFWEAPGQFVDWSVQANRYKFHTSDSGWGPVYVQYAPVSLGPTGALPTGKKPRAYLSGPPGLFNLNRANGGVALTVNGDALVLIDDVPA